MQIGATQGERRDAGALNAVPPAAWVQAWSQSRYMLPGWYGAGLGLEFARAERGIELLRRCYRGWPFFRNLIDDVEVMLARSDLAIASHYDRLAATELRHYSQPLREEYLRSCALVLEIKQCQALLQSNPTLQQLIAMRAAALDAVHSMQVDLLERWRATGRQNRELLEALQVSVSAIARALQSYG